MTVRVGEPITAEDVAAVARGAPAELGESARARMDAARALIERKAAAGETVYGVTTGLGSLANVRLEPGNIIYVPNQPFTTIKRYMNLILNSFVSTVAANEGIRAGGGTTGVGVTTTVNTSSK